MWSLFNLQMGLASLTFARKSSFLRLYPSHCHSIASGRVRFRFLKATRVFQRGFLLPARCAAQPAQLYGVGGGEGAHWHPAPALPVALSPSWHSPRVLTGALVTSASALCLTLGLPHQTASLLRAEFVFTVFVTQTATGGTRSNSQMSARTNAFLPLDMSRDA